MCRIYTGWNCSRTAPSGFLALHLLHACQSSLIGHNNPSKIVCWSKLEKLEHYHLFKIIFWGKVKKLKLFTAMCQGGSCQGFVGGWVMGILTQLFYFISADNFHTTILLYRVHELINCPFAWILLESRHQLVSTSDYGSQPICQYIEEGQQQLALEQIPTTFTHFLCHRLWWEPW